MQSPSLFGIPRNNLRGVNRKQYLEQVNSNQLERMKLLFYVAGFSGQGGGVAKDVEKIREQRLRDRIKQRERSWKLGHKPTPTRWKENLRSYKSYWKP